MALTTILPTSDDSATGTIVYSSGTTAWNLLDDDNDDTNHIRFDSDGDVAMNYGDMPEAAAVLYVQVPYWYALSGGGSANARAFVKIGATKYYSGFEALVVSGGTHAEINSSIWYVNPATAAPWTQVEVNALIAGVEISSWTIGVKVGYVPVVVSYVAPPVQVDVTRRVATFALWTLREAERFCRFPGNMDALGTEADRLELLGSAQLHHIAAPNEDGEGWENRPWRRRAVTPHSITVNPMQFSCDIELKDMRDLKTLIWWPAYSSRNSGALEDGIPRMLTPGATFAFTRASNDTFVDPLGDTVTVAPNVPAYTEHGLKMVTGSRALISNNSAARTWNAAQGTFECEVRLIAVSGGTQSIVYVFHNSDNTAFLRWDGAASQWLFRLRIAGVTYDAVFAATPSANTWYQIGVRWTGANLENDDPAYTISIFVDRVKGTDGTAPAAMTEQASASVDIGTSTAGGTEQVLNGYIRKISCVQYAKTDIEMGRTL